MMERRLHGVIFGSVGIEAEIVDAIGGGLCKKHGKYLGIGRHGLKACPFCDVDEYYKKLRNASRDVFKIASGKE